MAFVMGSEPAQVCGPARFATGARPAAALPAAGAATKDSSQTP
jgi:hypothetical protein